MVYDGLLMQILMQILLQISLELMGFIDQNLSIHVNTSVVLWPVVFKQSVLKRSIFIWEYGICVCHWGTPLHHPWHNGHKLGVHHGMAYPNVHRAAQTSAEQIHGWVVR